MWTCGRCIGKPRVIGSRFYKVKTAVFGFRGPEQLEQSNLKHAADDPALAAASARHPNLARLVASYQELGHLLSTVNPLGRQPASRWDVLQPQHYGLSLDDQVDAQHIILSDDHSSLLSVSQVASFLSKAYCGNLTGQLSYLPPVKRRWIAQQLERSVNQSLPVESKVEAAKLLLQSELFDNFLSKKFPTLKRYGLEGGEGQLAFFLQLFRKGKQLAGWTDVVIGMTHRGRLNLLTLLLNTPPSLLFHKVRGGAEMQADESWWTGDVVSHLQCDTSVMGLSISLLANPSHLELTNPVSMGHTRAKQLRHHCGAYGLPNHNSRKVINVQVHGDAALAGQGVNQETLAMSRVPHFSVGGSIHLVVNNQLGFTTPSHRGRSSRHPSDLAKTVEAPILLVNGDDPEAMMRTAEIAVKYVAEFEEDIFVEMLCYRRHGHNELDDPTVTNPRVYRSISNMETLPTLYIDQLILQHVLSPDQVSDWTDTFWSYLGDELNKETVPPVMSLQGSWRGMEMASKEITCWDTGVDVHVLRHLGLRSVEYPAGMAVHARLQASHINPRRKAMLELGAPLDWATAEALAIGSLLWQNFNVRISGQDVGRGTFAQRHVMLVDQQNGDIHVPLNDCQLPSPQGHLEVANSILSEEAVLAYEFGLSIESKETLVMWEAQFGDFVNSAQSIVDTYISGSQAKWARCSSLTMLLPHGYDGAGPEHSSARVERLLQLSNSNECESDGDSVNLQVAWPSTPAQYFHLLRRQQIRNFRLPLAVITPKTLLRLPQATSRMEEMGAGTCWQEVIGEEQPSATRVVVCCGKHYYTLLQHRPAPSHAQTVALVTLESLVPFPAAALHNILLKYPKAKDFVWSQEEPRNMGAWSFVSVRAANILGVNLRYVGREALPAPAYGLPHLHNQSLDSIIKQTFS